MVSVSFIIPLYNGLELTKVCLRTLQETLPAELEHEIILVDDGSTDGTREWLKSLPSSIRVILNETNMCYAAANNRGARVATGKYLALLNSDLELTPGWLEPMIAALENDTTLGLVGNVQRRVDDNSIDHAGFLFRADAKLVHIRELPSSASIRRRPVRIVPAVTAACCLIRRKVYMAPRRDGSHGLRETYRNGGEDVDFCLATQIRGHRVGVVLNSEIRHHVSASRGVESTRQNDEFNSRLLFGHWRGLIINLCVPDWSREKLRLWRRDPAAVPWRILLAAAGHRFGILKQTSRAAWIELGSAIFYEELHWRKTLGHPRPPLADDPHAYSIKGLQNDKVQNETWAFRERFTVTLAPGTVEKNLFVNGFVLPETEDRTETHGPLGLRLILNGVQRETFSPLPEDHFNCGINRPMVVTDEPVEFTVELLGAGRENTLAWLGRISSRWPLPAQWRNRLEAYRLQMKNRRLRISQIVCDGEVVYDFKQRRPLRVNRREKQDYPMGLNVVGWFRAELGIGESARCMARAVAAGEVPHALIDMKLPCLNRMGDKSILSQLQKTNPYRVNVFHIDAPVSRDIDHHHGKNFRQDRHNIAYWAWELPEFPDQWIEACQYFDEVWCPSGFVRDAIAAKVPLPVQVMPHAIGFVRPEGDQKARFELPQDRFTFLFLYDLNSYQERKNPRAVIEAYRRAFPKENDVQLVIKTHNPERNPEAFRRLKSDLKGIQNVTFIARTLSKEDIHALESACDAFVSLHRSEGFGLAVAESMFLGKPVISTDWSATAEFVNTNNGCPVPAKLIELTETHGPYEKGQWWADPDIDAAAEAMRRLATDSDLATRLGRAARRTMERSYSPEAIGQRYAKRLAAMEQWPD